jgi:hypothetical protein
LAGPAIGTFAGAARVLDEANLRRSAVFGHRALGELAALVGPHDRATGGCQRARAYEEEEEATHDARTITSPWWRALALWVTTRA